MERYHAPVKRSVIALLWLCLVTLTLGVVMFPPLVLIQLPFAVGLWVLIIYNAKWMKQSRLRYARLDYATIRQLEHELLGIPLDQTSGPTFPLPTTRQGFTDRDGRFHEWTGVKQRKGKRQ